MNDYLFDINHFAGELLSGERRTCTHRVLTLYQQGVSVYDIYTRLLQQSLYLVGDMWADNKISVADEHIATSVVETVMNDLYLRFVPANLEARGKALLACVPHEYHQIGIKMVGDVFEMNGWDSTFLGANTPVDDLIQHVQINDYQIVALSLSVYFHLPELKCAVEQLRLALPDIPILVGGQAFLHGGADFVNAFSGVHYVADLFSLTEYIRHFDTTLHHPKLK